MVVSYILSFIGAGIAAGSKNMYMFIGGQAVIGVGFSSVPLVYTVPSEILPRRWPPSKFAYSSFHRPILRNPIVAQACINLAASAGACVGPLIVGGLTKKDSKSGWRNFFVCEV